MDIILAQLTDPFRVGLVFFLLLTALRTRAAMGLVTPLVAGVVFIAAIIPLTTGSGGAPDTASRLMAIGAGVISNAIILAVFLGVWSALSGIRK